VRRWNWDEVFARRLVRQFLGMPASSAELADVAGKVCGVHAQMMPAAEMSLGIRVAGITRGAVPTALWVQRSLVKTYGIRGTIHLFPATELSLWMAALRANHGPEHERRLLRMGLDPSQRDAVVEAIGESLDGSCLTRDELGEEVARRAGRWSLDLVTPAFGGNWPRWQAGLGDAAEAGLLCFGPNRGTRVTYVRADQWIGGWQEMDRDAALIEVFRRYLMAYGPATVRDFAQWFNMQPGRANSLLSRTVEHLEEVDVEGWRAWVLPENEMRFELLEEEVVRLLPHFDCYVVGSHPRDRLVDGEWAAWRRAYGGAGNHPVVMIDGVLRGIWLYKRAGDRLDIMVESFQPLAGRQRDKLEAAAARLGEIVEAEPILSVGPVRPRPHL
jgi:hypothetical protein